jgi:ubiquinone/menaquinone biosynthesis C-methylase UbiE
MLARLRRRLDEAQVPVEVEKASAEALPFDDASFDTVVSTLVMCSVPDPVRAVAEIRRVLKSGGCYLFLEHGGSDDEGLARWQRRLDRAWTIVSAGCHLDRNITGYLSDAGLDLTFLETYEPRRAGPIKPFRLGAAS